VRLEDIDIMQVGLQGELYKTAFTLLWEVAMQSGDIDDDVYTRLGARYYFSENLFIELSAGEAYEEMYGHATV
jgi:outer membrane protein W